MASVIGYDPSGSLYQGSGKARARSGGRMAADDSVGNLIEFEVIPRLLVAHSEPPNGPGGPPPIITPVDIDRFAGLTLNREAHQVLEVAESYLRRGMSVECLFVDLLAPAARRLGQGWEDDSLDFVDVTMGLWRLQEVLREIAARTPRIASGAMMARTALFTAMPGEQHTLGTAMVDECFARAGWSTTLMLEPKRTDLLSLLASQSFDLVGLTVSCDSHIEQLPSLIVAIRNLSKNPAVSVMIGGRVPNLNPALAAFVGADSTASTATAAITVAERLVLVPSCLAAG
ncbi:MAG TPA: cobalamin B12-binding domain-containing protein [Allosphingosinicella sp.]|jgi:methanogenic corrinoid protein MtbC1